MTAIYKLYHRSGLLVDFQMDGGSDVVGAEIERALSAGWSVAEPEKSLGAQKTYDITGWVYGRSAKQGVPVVWLYSPVSPEHKVAQVYSEKIKCLPLGVDLETSGLKPFPGGLAPKKGLAKQDGWLNDCEPFTVLLEDTGDTFEGHAVYKFVKVLSSQPQPATSQPEGTTPFNTGKTAFAQQVVTLFDGNSLAVPWLIKRWTTKFTPANIRTEVDSMTDSECQKLADMCAQFAEKLVTDFGAFLVAGNAEKVAAKVAGQTVGK